MQPARSYVDDGAGGQIHVVEQGAGPAVLLLHQTPRSWDEFREVMTLLSGRMRLIAMDLPGMGQSSAPPRAATIEDYAAAAARVVAARADGPVTVCGHHTGGVAAIELAARRPDLVASLVLSSTPWIDAAARAERRGKPPIDTVRVASDGAHLAELWAQRAPYYPADPAYLQRFVADALAASDPAAGHRAVGQYRMEDAVPRIDCPVLLVDHLADPFACRHRGALAAALPQARVAEIAAGMVALEVTAAEFSQVLADWMDREGQTCAETLSRTG